MLGRRHLALDGSAQGWAERASAPYDHDMASQSSADQVLDRFARELSDRSAGLLIEGSAGIGKTFHYVRLVDSLAQMGWRVLEARPSESESRLGGCGLIDLLAEVSDAELGELPPPQRHALSVALLREVSDSGEADPRVVSVALTTLVRGLAGRQRVLVAVEDLQWLDTATESALAFLVKRAPESGLGFVGTLRTPSATPQPVIELETRGLLTRVVVPPLSTEAISELVASRVRLRLPSPLLARAAATSGGNPFYAVELARTWATAHAQFVDALPVPDSLQALVGARISGLPDASRVAVTTASAMRRPTESVLRKLDLDAGLPDAERAGIVTVSAGEVRFSHPLLAAAAYDALTGTERADLHRRLAAVDDELEARARHLALAAHGPDSSLAVELDAARWAAQRRGDPHAALELARLALHVSPPDDSGVPERRLALGSLLFRVGDGDAAQAELTKLDDDSVPDPVRARALVILCELAFSTVSQEAAREYGERALTLAEKLGDDAVTADAHIYLGQACEGDLQRATAHANQALAIVQAMDEPGPSRVALAYALAAGQQFYGGGGLNHELFERAVEVEERSGVPAEDGMIGYYAAMLGSSDEVDRAADVLAAWRKKLTDEVCESQLPFLLMWEANHAIRTGQLAEAERLIEAHGDQARRLGYQHNARYATFNRGRLALARGDLTAATGIGRELLGTGERLDVPAVMTLGNRLLGESSLYAADHEAALASLLRVEELLAGGTENVSAFQHLVQRVEAHAALGDVEQAERALAPYERKAREQSSPSALALAARSRALVAAARGQDESALAAFDESLAHVADERLLPFERARTLLLKGILQRRLKRKSAARETLTAARGAFDRLGSLGWVQRVDGEIGRIGLRRSAPTELTDTERRVAELAATGMTAKEIASAVFLSPRTVEDNLGRIYRKLGISSRAELGARLSEPPRP